MILNFPLKEGLFATGLGDRANTIKKLLSINLSFTGFRNLTTMLSKVTMYFLHIDTRIFPRAKQHPPRNSF